MMNDHGKSDRPKVPAKFAEQGRGMEARLRSGMEGRRLAKGNMVQAKHHADSAKPRNRECAKRA